MVTESSISYAEMAADEAREREALEWCEALIGDSFVERDADSSLRSE